MKTYHAFYETGGSYYYKTLAGATGAVIRAGGGEISVIGDDFETIEVITIWVKEV